MHQDQDSVYTSYAWTSRLLLRDHLQVSYSLDGARGNTEMEAFISRFKNENRSLLVDAPTIEALERVVTERMRNTMLKMQNAPLPLVRSTVKYLPGLPPSYDFLAMTANSPAFASNLLPETSE